MFKNLKNKTTLNTVMLLLYIVLLLVGFPISSFIGESAILVMVIIAILALFLLIYLHSKINEYCCPQCGYRFKISFIKDIFTINNLKGKKLKCPKCGYKGIFKDE